MRLAARLAPVGTLLAVLAVLAGCSSGTPAARPTPTTTPTGRHPAVSAGPPHAARVDVGAENARPGTDDWKILTGGDDRRRAVEGFADKVSAQRGESVRLFVTSRDPRYTVVAYRIGWYGGAGGREVWRSAELPGVVQPACGSAPTTHMVDCSNWAPSLTVTVGGDWPPGEYLFKLVGSAGHEAYIPFVVRDDSSRAAIVVINSVTTWQAYNTWGDRSLYQGIDGAAGRSTVVSFDRPYDLGWGGSGHFFGGTFELVQQLEAAGADVTYTTNVDEHLHPELLRNHRVVVSDAHDEYYSTAMRAGLEQARDAGVNIVFLGANAVYRRIRLEASPFGPARHEVNYRVAALDPLNGKDPSQVTTQWRDAPDPKPESALVGDYYECNPVKADMVVVDPGAWMFAGTRVGAGQHLADLVQNEYDRVTPEAPTPQPIEVLAHSPVTCRGRRSYADMSYYTTPSGAGVFATGTLWFVRQLGPACPDVEVSPAHPECQLRKLVANLLDAMSAGPVGRAHPAVSNLAALGIHPGYVHGGVGTGDAAAAADGPGD